MRNVFQLAVALPLLLAQVVSALPHTATASIQTLVGTDGSRNQIALDTNSQFPIKINADKPDFDREVLTPLRAAQAAKAVADAAKEKAAALAKRTTRVVRPIVIASGDVWSQLRNCEAGGDYTRNSGNGYYGAYQFDIGTWGNYGGFARPDLAPASVQDAKAQATQAARGWSPWPACSRKLGLM